jgi:hypothetical protein
VVAGPPNKYKALSSNSSSANKEKALNIYMLIKLQVRTWRPNWKALGQDTLDFRR